MAHIIDGKALAAQIKRELFDRSESFKQKSGRVPTLAVILVGDNPASQAYVRGKNRAAEETGISTIQHNLRKDVSADELERVIDDLNQDESVDGILLQLPLPSHLPSDRFLFRISPEKDADGLHPFNQGKLIRQDPTAVLPCTPLGCTLLIDQALKDLGEHEPSDSSLPSYAGKKATVVGRSILVGKPVGLLMLDRHATVTTAHSRTPSLETLCKEADILVVACGKPKLVSANWVKSGAIVIDVGISRNSEGKLEGDVDFDSVSEIASAITPVPGGVGPMTVAMLLRNTIDLAERRQFGL